MAVLAAVGRLTLGNMTHVRARVPQRPAGVPVDPRAGIGSIYEHNLYMSNLFSYLDDTATAAIASGRGRRRRAERTRAAALAEDVRSTGRAERGIRLERVSFRYPGKDDWVLRHVDLFIPRGQSVAHRRRRTAQARRRSSSS